MTRELTEFRVLSFDCYGTLIDWETGIWDAFQPLIARNQRTVPNRQALLLAFGKAESLLQSASPELSYPVILERVHSAIATAFDLQTSVRLDRDFAQSVPNWPAFPDTAEALRYLKSRYRLVILSNIHRAGFAASNRKLGVDFDAIYTAEDIGHYKPAPENFAYLLNSLEHDFGLRKADILHTAQSLFHDHVPASRMGLATAWIDRQRLSESGRWGATAEVKNRPETDYRFFRWRNWRRQLPPLSTDPDYNTDCILARRASMSSYCDFSRGNEIHGPYHDREYGFPISAENELFERLLLEINQAGLNWELILKKREGLRIAYDNFDVDTVANYGEAERARLLDDTRIIRNRLKVNAAIVNAGVIRGMRDSHGGFARWLQAHHPLKKADWVKLFRRTFKFTGGEITGEFLMSISYLPGPHRADCPVYRQIARLNPPWMDMETSFWT